MENKILRNVYGDKLVFQIIGMILSGIIMGVIPMLALKFKKKEKEIKNPNNHNSYSIISIYILYLGLFCIVVQFLFNLTFFLVVLLGLTEKFDHNDR